MRVEQSHLKQNNNNVLGQFSNVIIITSKSLLTLPSVSFSPESGGRVNPRRAIEEMSTQGTIRLKKQYSVRRLTQIVLDFLHKIVSEYRVRGPPHSKTKLKKQYRALLYACQIVVDLLHILIYVRGGALEKVQPSHIGRSFFTPIIVSNSTCFSTHFDLYPIKSRCLHQIKRCKVRLIFTNQQLDEKKL